ncbi:MAG: CDP-alcohol phosphatidyltransferase family protein [Eubacterium sp.]|nr:CDP-alcohol phosphatidyltransferase family protein [Eubacterium sp.]
MLGVYNYTVVLTYVGMLAGFSGILRVLEGDTGEAMICLMIAGLCDMFDGKIASTMIRTRKEKRFGVQIDSLSDLVCFGVLPALIAYTCSTGKLRIVPSAVYLLCALIRLAWFNVDEEERQDREMGSRRYYYGLPVTCAALILPCIFILCAKLNWPFSRFSSIVLLCMAAAFLTPFRVKKPSFSWMGKCLSGMSGIVSAVIVRKSI